jgi:hypothetical protein
MPTLQWTFSAIQTRDATAQQTPSVGLKKLYQVQSKVYQRVHRGQHAVVNPETCAVHALLYSGTLRNSISFFLICEWGETWVHLVRWPLVGLQYQLWMVDEYGYVDGMTIGRGNRGTPRNLAALPLCPPQFQHDMNWDHGGKRVTNCLSYGKTLQHLLMQSNAGRLSLYVRLYQWCTKRTN